MARAPSSGRKLNNRDAEFVKAMLARRDRQHDIAAYFAVNGGRIGETSTGAKFAHVHPTTAALPPAAPYVVLSASLRADADAILKDLETGKSGSTTINRIKRIIEAMELSKDFRRGK